MGLAVDVDKGDGTRTLVVPVIRNADTLDFAGFLAAYEDLIRKVKSNKLTVERLPGRHDHADQPRHDRHGPERAAADARPGRDRRRRHASTTRPSSRAPTSATLGSFGVSKVVTITSTYDHRIIQGAESGHVPEAGARAAARRARLLRRACSRASACRTRRSSGAPTTTRSTSEEAMLHKQMQVATLIRVHRVRGHLIADLDPLRWKEPQHARRARPGDLRPDDLGPRPRVPHRRRRRRTRR